MPSRCAAPGPTGCRFTVIHGEQRVAVHTRFCGVHWIHACLAAITTGVGLGVPIPVAAAALAAVDPLAGRYQPVEANGVTFIRDEFKASLWSVAPALEFLRDARAVRKVAVFGTISDYGGRASQVYADVARQALEVADEVIFVGPQAVRSGGARTHPKGAALRAFPGIREAHRHLADTLVPGDLVLLKGSQRADHLLRLVLARRGRIGVLEDELPADEVLRRVSAAAGSGARLEPFDVRCRSSSRCVTSPRWKSGFLVPTYASRWSPLSVAAHRMLALPAPAARSSAPARGGVGRPGDRGAGDRSRQGDRATLRRPVRRAARAGIRRSSARSDIPPPRPERPTSWSRKCTAGSRRASAARAGSWCPAMCAGRGALAELPPPQASHSLKDDLRKVRAKGFTLEHADGSGGVGGVHDPDAGAPRQRAVRRRCLVPVALSAAAFPGARPSCTSWSTTASGSAGSARCGAGGPCGFRSSACETATPRCSAPVSAVATYALGFEWARRQGCTRVDMGRTSPFLHDGVQQYKRKWGLTRPRSAGAPDRRLGRLRCGSARLRPRARARRGRRGTLALRRGRAVIRRRAAVSSPNTPGTSRLFQATPRPATGMRECAACGRRSSSARCIG